MSARCTAERPRCMGQAARGFCTCRDTSSDAVVEVRTLRARLAESTFKLDDDKDALGRLCALSWFDGVRGEYELLVNVGEDDARQLAAKLTAWLDAPRLEARKTPTVVADRDGFRLLTTTSGEWGISDDEAIGWLSCEDEARHEFRDATGTVSCEACARFIDRDDAAFDSEGIYTCDNEAACGAAYDAKEQR